MTRKLCSLLLFVLSVPVFIAACGDLPADTDETNVSRLKISPASAEVSVGNKAYFSATATYVSGSTAIVNPAWSVSSGIGTVTSVGYTGMFTASAEGTGVITATYGGKTATAEITVTPSVTSETYRLATIEVYPQSIELSVGASQTFTATGYNASNESIAFEPVWSVSGDATVNFSASGTVATLEATGLGQIIVNCISGEVAGHSSVTIEGYSLVITAESDTYVDQGNPAVSYEAATSLKAGYLSATPGTYYETYLRFSLAGLPYGASIEAATLEVYATATGSTSFQLYNLTSAFSAATCWTNKPATGTYLLSKAFTAGAYNSLSNDALLDVVRQWYASSITNFGLAIKQDGGDNGLVVVLSRENATNRPILRLLYK